MIRTGAVSRRKRSSDMIGESFDDDVSPSDSHEVHVLAVDDSLVDRKVIERLLKITSCKVTAVDSGRRALQFLGLDEDKSSVDFDLKVDLIITDYCMPGMTGYDLLKRIKGSSSFREIPVVIMSSENVLARIDRCLEEGAEDFILKPVKLSDVKRLKGSMFGDDQVGREDRMINHRNSPEPSYLSSSPSQQSITPPSLPPLLSPSLSLSLLSSPNSSPLSFLSLPSLAPSSSRTLLDSSPSRPLEITNCDDDLE
ncbi:unnamed protein product [Camellia sinensis]